MIDGNTENAGYAPHDRRIDGGSVLTGFLVALALFAGTAVFS